MKLLRYLNPGPAPKSWNGQEWSNWAVAVLVGGTVFSLIVNAVLWSGAGLYVAASKLTDDPAQQALLILALLSWLTAFAAFAWRGRNNHKEMMGVLRSIEAALTKGETR